MSDDIQRLVNEIAAPAWQAGTPDEERAAELISSVHRERHEQCRIDLVVPFRDEQLTVYMIKGAVHMVCDDCHGLHWVQCRSVVVKRGDAFVQLPAEEPCHIDAPLSLSAQMAELSEILGINIVIEDDEEDADEHQ